MQDASYHYPVQYPANAPFQSTSTLPYDVEPVACGFRPCIAGQPHPGKYAIPLKSTAYCHFTILSTEFNQITIK